MFFLSAQPDSIYFKWQIEVQLNNFEKIGINLSDVYVLVGYKDKISDDFLNLSKNTKANVLFYPDERGDVKYISTIRPHIIKKFFIEYPHLTKDYCFYHDSDIIFRKLPPFENWMDGKTWSVSDTKSYIGYDYIAEKGIDVLLDMCEVVKINPSLVRQMQPFSGGCQYFLINTDYEFWNKVERDCEMMFKILHENHDKYNKAWERQTNKYLFKVRELENKIKLFDSEYKSIEEYDKHFYQYHRIQEWCSDMWAVLWNAWQRQFVTVIRKELDFSWSNTPIQNDEKNYIYHNAGVTFEDREKYFYKGQYTQKSPYEDYLLNLSQNTCGKYYIDEILETGEKLGYKIQRYNIKDTPKVQCVMTTYGRFTCVERSIKCFLEQDYQNKHLLIWNTAPIPLILGESLKNKNISIVNQQAEIHTGNKYSEVGTIRQDAFNYVYDAKSIYICWDDDDIYTSKQHISRGVEHLLKSGKPAWKPFKSYFTNDGGETFDSMNNAFEASVLTWMSYVKEYKFNKVNGTEHKWFFELSDKDLVAMDDITPSYLYVWGDNLAPHKQSGDMTNPNNFENHKNASIDFGNRALEELPESITDIWTDKISKGLINN